MAGKKDPLFIAVVSCNKKATNVVIPEGVNMIQRNAFMGCESLASVTIPKSVTRIDDWAFIYCRSLESVTIPESVKVIGYWAFDECRSLAEIRFGGTMAQWEKVKKGDLCFKDTTADCVKCTDGDVPLPHYLVEDGVLRWWHFGDTKAIIPADVIAIEDYAFQNCTSLSEIHFSGTMEQWSEVEKREWWLESIPATCVKCTNGDISLPHYVIKNGILNWRYQDDKEAIIPDSVKKIGSGAFRDCRSLVSITIPSSIKEICIGAFSNCKSLASVTILKGVKKIDHFAFGECESLTSIAMPEGINKIGSSVFHNCTSLASVTIPKSIKELGGLVFEGCAVLSEIHFDGTIDQWKAVQKQDTWKGWDVLPPAKVVHCTDGDAPL